MDKPIALKEMTHAVSQTIQACWTVGSTLFELQKEKTIVSETLFSTNECISSLRNRLELYHVILKRMRPSEIDESEYEQVWIASNGSISDIESFLKRYLSVLHKMRRNSRDKERSSTEQMHSFRIKMHKPELERSQAQIQGYKRNVNLCLTMLVVHICAEMAAQPRAHADGRQLLLPNACQKLERTMEIQSMSSYESFETQQVFRLRETAKSVLTHARSIATMSSNPDNWDSYTESAYSTTSNSSPDERDLMELWIRQLRAVADEAEDRTDSTYSDLPEVLSSPSPTQEPSASDGKISPDFSLARPFSEYHEDDFLVNMVNQLTEQGKDFITDNSPVQAAECLERALEHASSLPLLSASRVDLTEIRALLGHVHMERNDLVRAERYLQVILAESANTPENQPFIATAHLQVASINLHRRSFAEARHYCNLGMQARMRLYGKRSSQSYEAVKLQALIYHAEGSRPEADAILRMLPNDLADQARAEMSQQSQTGIAPVVLLSSPYANLRRPSTIAEQPSISRPTTMHQKSPTTISNGTSLHGKDSKYSDQSSPTSVLGPPVRLERVVTQPPNTIRAPSAPASARKSSTLPFRNAPYSPGSPHAQETVAFSPGPFTPATAPQPVRALSTPNGYFTNMESLSILSQGGFHGDFDAGKALIWAIQNGHERVVRFLLEGFPVARPKRRFSLGNETSYVMKQVDANSEIGKAKEAPLNVAIQYGQVLIVRLLVDRGAEVVHKGNKKEQPLMLAAQQGSAEIIRLLFDRGAQADLTGKKRNWTIWHAAAEAGHLEVVQFLYDRDAVIDAEDHNGATALKLAASRGHATVCDFLIENSARVDHADNAGWTPLMSSVKHGHTRVTVQLLKADADFVRANNKLQTPLMLAAREGREQETELLIERGADLEKCDDKSWTPLLAAARYGHVEVTQLLIRHGANVNAACSRGSTPLDHAVRSKNKAVQQFIRGAGGKSGSGLTEPHSQNTAFTGYTM